MPLEFAMPSPKGYCGLAVDMRCRSSFFFSGTPPSSARLGTADDRPVLHLHQLALPTDRRKADDC